MRKRKKILYLASAIIFGLNTITVNASDVESLSADSTEINEEVPLGDFPDAEIAAVESEESGLEMTESEETELYQEEVELLTNYGFVEETAEALSDDEREELAEYLLENPDDVDIETTVMEVDNLEEIEKFVSLTDEELLEMEIAQEEIELVREEIYDMYEEENEVLIEEYDIDQVEIDMFRMAVESGEETKENDATEDTKIIEEDVEDTVYASGTISSAKLTYTQSVTNMSTATSPQYRVICSYKWNSSYALAVFSDKIAIAWGGGLNSKQIKAIANYYTWSQISMTWLNSYSKYTMSKDEKVQKGLIGTFPQSVYKSLISRPKTKNGSISLTLYQTKKKGYSTKVVSNYCHRVLSVGSTSISISGSGASASISIGGAWDKTWQKSSTISY